MFFAQCIYANSWIRCSLRTVKDFKIGSASIRVSNEKHEQSLEFHLNACLLFCNIFNVNNLNEEYRLFNLSLTFTRQTFKASQLKHWKKLERKILLLLTLQSIKLVTIRLSQTIKIDNMNMHFLHNIIRDKKKSALLRNLSKLFLLSRWNDEFYGNFHLRLKMRKECH